MGVLDILLTYANDCGWSDDSMLSIACRYIDNQAAPDAFADFVAQQAAYEEELAEWAEDEIARGQAARIEPGPEVEEPGEIDF